MSIIHPYLPRFGNVTISAATHLLKYGIICTFETNIAYFIMEIRVCPVFFHVEGNNPSYECLIEISA